MTTPLHLLLLGIVAAWRVVLMIQVVSTLFRISAGRAMFPVFLFADSLVVVILILTPLPVFSLMGGIRLSESEQLIQATAFFVGAIGILSWPIWLIGSVVVATKPLGPQTSAPISTAYREPMSQSSWGLGIASLLVLLCILPFTQPEQQLRRDVENLLREGQIHQALEIMSAHERQDFPPHWDPPPRIGYGEITPELPKVLETLIQIEAKPWVAEMYWEKFSDQGYLWHRYLRDLNEEEFDRHLTILENRSKNAPVLRELHDELQSLVDNDDSLTESQRNRIRELLGDEAVNDSGKKTKAADSR